MIKIEHDDLDQICIDYCKAVKADLLARAKELEKVLIIIEKDPPGDVGHKNRGLLRILLNHSDTINKTVERKALIAKLQTDFKQRIVDTTAFLEAIKYEELLDKLLSLPPYPLKKHHDELKKRLDSEFNLLENDKLLSHLLNYDHYGAHIKSIPHKLEIRACPYCNRNLITTIKNMNGKRVAGPQIDHFFAQSAFPLLAISFYNLIPSCGPCNSSTLKWKIEFDLDVHLHPYIGGLGKYAQLDFELSADLGEVKFLPFFKINAQKGKKSYKRLMGTDDPKKNGKNKNPGSMNVFALPEIYRTHAEVVEEIHEKFDRNSPHYLKSIAKQLKEMGVSEKEFFRFHFGNYFEEADFHKRPLSKLTRDIYNKMNEINPLFLED